MRTLLIGGTGFLGGKALDLLGKGSAIQSVQIGSRSLEKAEKAAASAPCAAKAIKLDIGNEASLEHAIAQCELVLNAAGDAPETAPGVIRAAIKLGKPYVDLSAEVSVLHAAERLVQQMGPAHVPIILGAGIHPGMVELLGMHAAKALDRASRVDMFLLATLEDYGPPDQFIPLFQGGWKGINGLQTMCRIPGMTATQVCDGKRCDVPAEQGDVTFKTLEGTDVRGFAMATMEPLVMNRALGGVVETSMTMSFWPPSANPIAREAAAGFLSGERNFAPVMEAMWSTIKAETGPRPSVHFWARATGQIDARPASVTAFSRQDWANQQGAADTTAKMLAHTANAIARGEVSGSGLLAPVEVFEPAAIFEALADPERPEVELQFNSGSRLIS